LSRRLPSGEAEKTQKAIQQYLVLRELKYQSLRVGRGNYFDQIRYTILHKKDDVLSHLKQHIPNITVCAKDQFTLENTAECIIIPFVTVIVGPAMLKKRQKVK
jgi:hypothetical protein